MEAATTRAIGGLWRSLGLAAIVSGLALPAGATVITLQPPDGKDAHITRLHPNINFGGFGYLTANWGIVADAGLLEFDLGFLAGTTVNSATLVMYHEFNDALVASVGLFLNTSPWSEETVTWESAPSYNPVPTSVLVFPNSATGVFRSWDLTSAVEDWTSGTPNYGIRIQRTDQENSFFYLVSSDSDHLPDSFSPALIIDYTVPEPGTPVPEPGTLLLVGSIGLAGLAARRRGAS